MWAFVVYGGEKFFSGLDSDINKKTVDNLQLL